MRAFRRSRKDFIPTSAQGFQRPDFSFIVRLGFSDKEQRAKVVGALIFFSTYHINSYSVSSFYIFALISLVDLGQKELK